MSTSLDEPVEFLGIAASKGFLNDNTVNARRTACKKFFDILDENQKTVEYVRDNLEVIKARFMNLNKDVAGATVEEYKRRVKLVLDDFSAWKADRAAWERDVSSRQSTRAAGDGEKKTKPKPEKPKAQQTTSGSGTTHQAPPNPDTRVVTFPIRPDFELSVTLPRAGISVDELKRLVYFLLPYAQDWEPSQSPRSVFPMLERDDSRDQ
jgi:hypothetical protein